MLNDGLTRGQIIVVYLFQVVCRGGVGCGFAAVGPDRWHVDETYVKVNGVWRYVYRAVDQYGQVVDVLVSGRRDADAPRRFFRRALSTLKVMPSEVVTDAAAVYPSVLDELIPQAWHHVEQYANKPDRG